MNNSSVQIKANFATKSSNGLIYLYTGEGKGKTSAAFGAAARALSAGWRVSWVAFYKESAWDISESHFAEQLSRECQKRWEMFLLGKGFFIAKPEQELTSKDVSLKVATTTANTPVVDTHVENEHRLAAAAALTKAMEILDSDFPPQVLVIDEVCNAIADNLIEEQEVLNLIERRGQTHIILTGRFASAELIAAADLVTEMKKIKHPYDQGVLAIKGLDF